MASLLLVAMAVAAGCKTDNAPTPTPSTGGGTTTQPDVTISLNSGAIEQTMGGWQVPILGTARDYLAIAPYAQDVFSQGVNDLGLNRIALEIYPGVESPSGLCQQQYFSGAVGENQFLRECAYNPINDNNDPSVINPSGFHWDLLDWEIDTLLLPMKRAMDGRGEPLYVDIRYVDYAASAYEPQNNTAEYTEVVLALFQHMQAKYGFVPDGFEIINEPDLATGWGDPAMIGRLAAATGARLKAAGFTPELLVPGTTDKGNAAPYFETIMNQAGAREYVKEIGWHCYRNSDSNSSAAIGAKALAFGVRSAQTECWNDSNTYQLLLSELKTSRNAMWSMGTIQGVNGYYAFSNGTFTIRDRAKYMRQYYKYVRAGAKKIGATSTNATYDPVAFVNTDGRYVVVVKASAAGSFTIGNLPAGTYGIYSTTGPDPASVTAYDVTAPDQTVTASGRLTTSIQGAGVITIFARGQNSTARSADAPQALAPVAAAETSSPGVETAVPTSITTKDGIRLDLRWLAGDVRNAVDLAVTPDARAFIATAQRIDVTVGESGVTTAMVLSPDAVDGQEELQAIALDAGFADNHFVYTLSTTGETSRSFRLSRYVDVGNRLRNRVVLLDGVPADADVSAALRVAADGTLYVAFDQGGRPSSVGDAGSYNGKLLRLNADGTTPRDQVSGSPVVAQGYHFPRGLDWDRRSNVVWLASQDAQGVLDVLGSDGSGSERHVLGRYALPPDVEPSAVAVYRAERVPELTGNVFVASARGRELLRVQPNASDRTQTPTAERLFGGDVGGVRAVAVSAAGEIYVATDRGVGVLVPQP